MEKLGYKVETQTFTATPPPKFGGPVNMTNIFGTLNPSAPRRLVLACHFDSKLDSFGQFVGATDSAVPCAQMLDVATTLNSFLKKSNIRSSVTLQLLFFDGEEAYGDWSVTDSLYGARNLSEVWKATPNQFAPDDPSLSELNSIDLMVLLDLIGTIDTNFRNFYYSAHLHFEKMNSIETKLEDKGLIKQWGRSRPYFDLTPLPAKKWVDDDYRPFIEKGVKVMHLISTPFPSVWHKTSDNLDNIHYETIDDINKMLRVYVCGYLACNVEKPMYWQCGWFLVLLFVNWFCNSKQIFLWLLPACFQFYSQFMEHWPMAGYEKVEKFLQCPWTRNLHFESCSRKKWY